MTRYPDAKTIAFQAAVGRRIQEVADERGISIASLCRRANVCETTLRTALRGERAITLKNAHDLAEALDCTLDDIVPVMVGARA